MRKWTINSQPLKPSNSLNPNAQIIKQEFETWIINISQPSQIPQSLFLPSASRITNAAISDHPKLVVPFSRCSWSRQSSWSHHPGMTPRKSSLCILYVLFLCPFLQFLFSLVSVHLRYVFLPGFLLHSHQSSIFPPASIVFSFSFSLTFYEALSLFLHVFPLGPSIPAFLTWTADYVSRS